MTRIIIFLMSGIFLVTPVVHADGLDADQIEKYFADKTIKGFHHKRDFSFRRYYGSDGKLIGVSDPKGRRTGQWESSDKGLCHQWDGRKKKCRKVEKDGDEIKQFTKKGRHSVSYQSFINGDHLEDKPETSETRPVTKKAVVGFALDYSKDQLIKKWSARIKSLLEDGKLPLIDVQTSFKQQQIDRHIPDDLDAFDEYAIAMMMADGYQQPEDGSKGHRWSNYILKLVNDYPDYFVPTANGGTRRDWLAQKTGGPEHYIDQMEKEIRSGKYFSMGEVDFLHYMSNKQCKKNKTHRDSNIPLNGKSGHRFFKLAEDNNVILIIHLEPEDHALDALEEMLKTYPRAKIVVAHFTQLRKPKVQQRFTPKYVRHLLSSYSNLHYDLAVGKPNRKYRCLGPNNDELIIGDTAIWSGEPGDQGDTIRADYKSILTEFSDRFVFSTDFGGGRKSLPAYFKKKTANFHQIIRDLPEEAKHNIAYRNAWRLLTGDEWK